MPDEQNIPEGKLAIDNAHQADTAVQKQLANENASPSQTVSEENQATGNEQLATNEDATKDQSSELLTSNLKPKTSETIGSTSPWSRTSSKKMERICLSIFHVVSCRILWVFGRISTGACY